MANYAARAPRKESEVQWTQEDKDRYAEQWKTFGQKRMGRVQEGQSRDFNVVLVSISDLAPKTSTYKGVTTTKLKRTICVQATDPSINMLRFYADTADNPFFHKTMLNNVLRACGIFPKEEEGLDVDFEDLVGTKLIATIEKQGQRTDGKNAGFYTKILAFKPAFDEDDEEEAPAPAPKPAAKAAAKSSASTTNAKNAKAAWEDEDEGEEPVPF